MTVARRQPTPGVTDAAGAPEPIRRQPLFQMYLRGCKVSMLEATKKNKKGKSGVKLDKTRLRAFFKFSETGKQITIQKQEDKERFLQIGMGATAKAS